MKRFKNILCIVEFGKDNKLVLERAVMLSENNQAKLTVIIVSPLMNDSNDMLEDRSISTDYKALPVEGHKQELDNIVESYRQRIKIETEILSGLPFLEIIRKVLRDGHDLVIKCPESQDWLDRLFSSDDKKLLRKCPCPVWMVKPLDGESYHRILAAVDVDESHASEELKTRRALNDSVMELAGSLAVSQFAELHVVHTWEAVGEGAIRHAPFIQRPENEVNAYVEKVRQHHTQLLEALIKQLSVKLGENAISYIKPELHMIKGAARKEIPALVKQLQVDCVVMGTVGRVGVPGFFMGNTAESILDQLECSVLAIKPPGFVTPVTLEEKMD